MKTPLRTFLLAAAGLLLLALVAWVATFLYWHSRITNAVRIVEKSPRVRDADRNPKGHQAYSFLSNAGCRSLPYAVRAIDGSRDRAFIRAMVDLIEDQLITNPGPFWSPRNTDISAPNAVDDDKETAKDLTFLADWRSGNREPLGPWWIERGGRYHQWWRVWSPRCGP